MSSVLIKEIGRVITGNTPSKNNTAFYSSNDIGFIKPDIISDKKITYIKSVNEFISEQARSKARIIKNSAVLITCIGIIGKICVIKDEEYAFNQQINAVVPYEKVSAEYLAYCLLYNKNRLIQMANAPVVPIINKTQFENFQINIIDDREKQNRIVEILNQISNVIEMERRQLEQFDELIKSRFVEMFGDPVSNPYGYEKVALSELADIKIGPFGSFLHKEDYIEGGHPLVNPSHIIDGQVVPDDKLTISDKKYKELSPYHLKKGDVVMGRRGEMGRCAVVLGDGYLCGTGSLLIRSKGDVTADYIQKIISFPSFKKTIEDMAVGQTMSNLNVPIVSKFQIIKPPMKIQDDYYTFIHQIDKLKVVAKKMLDKQQLLFNCLMQQYFG